MILVVGLPGCGKTTLVRRLAEDWGQGNCAGFFTQEKREGNKRTGFFWETFDGVRGALADLREGQPRVGKYRVDLPSFEECLDRIAGISSGKILVIDEVGKMECLSQKFCSLLPVWERAECLRIFTVPVYGTPFIEQFKARNRAQLVQMTRSNRDEIFERLRRLGT